MNIFQISLINIIIFLIFYYLLIDYNNILDQLIQILDSKFVLYIISYFILFFFSIIIKKKLKSLFKLEVNNIFYWILEKPESNLFYFRIIFELLLNNDSFLTTFCIPSFIFSFFLEIIWYSNTIQESTQIVNRNQSEIIHYKLFIIQFFLLIINFYLIVKSIYLYINFKKIFFLSCIDISIELFIRTLVCIYSHLLNITDLFLINNTFDSEITNYFVQNLMNLFNSLKFILISSYRLYFTWCSFYSLIQMIISFIEFIFIYDQYSNLNSILKGISNLLIDVTIEDLQKDDICIICREKMKIGNSKKLPCSHCYHKNCLERWICRTSKCPICQITISFSEIYQIEDETIYELEESEGDEINW